MLQGVGYLRRSTDMQDRSLDDQRKAIEGFAAAQCIQIANWYVDDAVSGTSAHRRTAFHRMLDDALQGAGGFDYILVYDVKRFGRMDNDETGYYRYILRQRGIQVLYVSEAFTGGFEDDLIRPVKQWQARQESKDLAKVVIRGFVSKFNERSGFWMAGVPPYGFDRRYEDSEGRFLFTVRNMQDLTKQMLDEQGAIVRVLGPSERLILSDRDRCRLVPGDPDRIQVAQRVYHDYVEGGLGCTAIANRLNHEGVPTALGARGRTQTNGRWTYATLRNMLLNPAYAGDLVWNRRTAGKFFRIEGQRAIDRMLHEAGTTRFNSMGDWMVFRNAHEPLVSRHVHDQARALLVQRNEARGRLSRDPHREDSDFRARYVLTGLIECVNCSGAMWGGTCTRYYSHRRRRPYRARMYECRSVRSTGSRPRSRRCMIRQRVLERLVVQRVVAWYASYLAHGGEGVMREAALRQRHAWARIAGQPATTTIDSSEVDSIVRSAIEFLAMLRERLTASDPQTRRLSFRRCIERVRIDIANRRIAISLRKLPLLGATAGGLAVVRIRLQKDPENLRMGPKKEISQRREPYTLGWHLAGKPPCIVALVSRMRDSILSISPSVRESCTMRYIAYSVGFHFACVKVQRSRLLIYLKLDPQQIDNWTPSMRDVTGIGTQATGDVEVAVTSWNDFQAARDLVVSAFQRVAQQGR